MNREDVIKVLKGAGIAAGGAALTYLSQWATSTDFGDLTPLVVAVLSVAINTFRKWATGSKPQAFVG